MAVVQGEIFIDRPPEVVFAYVADERNEPSYNARMTGSELVSDGPIGPGSRFRATVGSKAGPTEMVIEFTAYEPPRCLESVTTMPRMQIHGGLTFLPRGSGTLMRWSWDLRPQGALRLFSPLVAAAGRRQERKVWGGLKALLERPGEARSAGDRGAWVLVVHASRYGATQGIAERVATRLRSAGLLVDVEPARSASSPEGYAAVVIGSAVYRGSWVRDALRYVRRHHAALAERPLWLFSSGPLGADAEDDFGSDKIVRSEPEQVYIYRSWLHPRGQQVFFGSLRRRTLRRSDRVLARLSATRAGWGDAEGDFRDWAAIDRWADGIAATVSSGRATSAGNVGEGGRARSLR